MIFVVVIMEMKLGATDTIGKMPRKDVNPERDSLQTTKVYDKGMSIGMLEGADAKILEQALLFLYSGDTTEDSAKVAKWEMNNKYSKDEIAIVTNAILSDPLSDNPAKPESKEAKVLQDAAKLCYIGDPGESLVSRVGGPKCWNYKKRGEWYLNKLIHIMNNGFLHTKTAQKGYMDDLNYSLKLCEAYLETDVRSILEKELTIEAWEKWIMRM